MDRTVSAGPGKFKPSQKLRTLYYVYLGIISPVVVLPWYFFLLVEGPIAASLGALVPVILTIGFLLYWIPKFYDSISYRLTETEVVWRRGVWFRNTGIVPYDRITNVDIAQGPISRRLGIAALKIQTAGYSGERKAEIRLEGIENSEELRESIMNSVRGQKPQAVETYAGGKEVNSRILQELCKIRELLEGGIDRAGEKEC